MEVDNGDELRTTDAFMGTIDPGIEKVLAKLDSEAKGTIIEELDDDYEIDILLETREIIFRHAKAKLKNVTDNASKSTSENDTLRQKTTKESEIEAIALVGRRSKHRVIEDILKLMGYVSEQNDFFPYKITKREKCKSAFNIANAKDQFAQARVAQGGAESTDESSDSALDLVAADNPQGISKAPVEQCEVTTDADEGTHDGESGGNASVDLIPEQLPSGEPENSGRQAGGDPVLKVTPALIESGKSGQRAVSKAAEKTGPVTIEGGKNDKSICSECKTKLYPIRKTSKDSSTNTPPQVTLCTMATQTNWEDGIFSQSIPAEQVGIDSVLIEMDEKAERMSNSIRDIHKTLNSNREEMRAFKKVVDGGAKKATESDNMNNNRYAGLKNNQLALMKEVKWLREVVVRAGFASETGANCGGTSKQTSAGPSDQGGYNPTSARKDVGCESVWDIDTPAQNKARSDNTNTTSGSKAGSSLGKYLAQMKATSVRKPNTNAGESGRKVAAATRSNAGSKSTPQGGAQRGTVVVERSSTPVLPGGRAPSANILDISSGTGGSAQPIVIREERPYDEQYPSTDVQGKQNDPRAVNWADEVPDSEMARFYTKQREDEKASAGSAPAGQRHGNSHSGATADSVNGTRNGADGEGVRAVATANTSEPAVSVVTVDDVAVDNDGNPADPTADSYADAAGQWSPPARPYKRKWDKRDKKTPLKGVSQSPHRDIYIQGISTEGFSSKDEAITMVKDYCKFAHIFPTQAVVIPVRDDDSQTGCKITVKEKDAESLMVEDFWPDGIFARPWKPRPRGDNIAKAKPNVEGKDHNE